MPGNSALTQIWRDVDAPLDLLGDVALTGRDPGLAAQSAIAAAALAAADLWRLRSGRRQSVAVDMRHAAAEFRSGRHLLVDGRAAPDAWDKIAGIYRCEDEGWIRLHTNFPHHRDGILALLGCRHERAAVQQALDRRGALEFEEEAVGAGMVVAALRSFAEWDAHPQGKAVAGLPLVAIERLGEAPAFPLPPADRPLSGLRVLDLTRIIAGPVCGRCLAAHGADVLLVTGPHLPAIETLMIDTERGKRSTRLDLRQEPNKECLRQRLAGADVFVQGYRPAALAERGFGPEEAARIRPGIVYVSLSAYGHEGPWSGRRGFDSLVQTASGGFLGIDTYYVVTTAVTALGETTAGKESSIQVISGSVNEITVTVPATAGSITSYNVYVSNRSGGWRLSGNTATTSYTITVLPPLSALTPPTTNSSGVPSVANDVVYTLSGSIYSGLLSVAAVEMVQNGKPYVMVKKNGVTIATPDSPATQDTFSISADGTTFSVIGSSSPGDWYDVWTLYKPNPA